MVAYDIKLEAGSISDERFSIDAGVVDSTATFAIVSPTRTTPDEFDIDTRNFYPDTPEEIVPLVPVQSATIHIAEAAHRGAGVLDDALKDGNDRLIEQLARSYARQGLLDIFAEQGRRVTDKDGNVIEEPNIGQIEGYTRRTFGDDAFDGYIANIRTRITSGDFGSDYFAVYKLNGYRHISYVQGLAEELRSHEVEMDKFITPEEYPEAEMQLLADKIKEAAPCVRETDMNALGFTEEEQEAGHAKCEQLGRDIGRILAGAEVAVNDNDLLPPAGMSIFALPQVQTVDAGRGQ